ncbi:MAG: hypothetical protein QM489_05165 [Candidatus Izemoplasma sp.]
MIHNYNLAKISVAIILVFLIRLIFIVFDLSVVGGIVLGIDYSMLTLGCYGIVLISFIVSFSYFMRMRSIKSFKVLLVSTTSLILLGTVIFGIIYFYACTVEGF